MEQRKHLTYYEQMKAAAMAGGSGHPKIKKVYVYQGPDGKIYQDATGHVYVSKRRGA